MSDRRPPRRGVAVAAVALVVVVGLAVAAVAVVRRGGGAADGRRTETVPVEAPRGRILDRSGTVLVEDGSVLQVRAERQVAAGLAEDERSALLDALALVLVADREDRFPAGSGVATGAPITAERLGDALDGDTADVVLAAGVGPSVRDAVEASPEQFPGITVAPVGGRVYHYGALAAHVLGYLGRVTEAEREERSDEDLPVDAVVGRAGIEAARDAELRGEPGRIVYEVDAAGRRVRELVDQREEPTRGRDVYLTIDIDLQYLVEQGLAAEVERRRGVLDGSGCAIEPGCEPTGAASVALDPRNGEVLALASYPTYDPSLFVDGISTVDYDALADEDRRDEHGSPLLDRGIGGQYAPGATIKPFVAHAGLAAGLLTPTDVYEDTGVHRFTPDCPVEVDSSCAATNVGRTPHGPIDLADSLRVSSDTYFYALGDRAWRQRDALGEEVLQEGVEAWGFGAPTGLDLLGDVGGRVPTPRWLMDFSRELNGDTEQAREAGTWTPGTNGNLAAGQGDLLVTPIQLAQGYATLANGGTIWRPQLVLQTTAYASADDVAVIEPDATGEVDLPPDWRDPIVEGLDGVTKAPDGTATRLFQGFDQTPCPVMAKTGTARVTGKDDTSLFAAVAPTPGPGRESVIALATVVEHAGHGVDAAGPHARRVLEPFAAAGCDATALDDPTAFGGPDGPYAAPLGGRIDVADAIASFTPTAGDPSD